MHLLAEHYRSEFLACPQLTRLAYPTQSGEHEATLLLKAGTVLLKYVTVGTRMRLILSRVRGRILYGVEIQDFVEAPAFLWSVLEREEEIEALKALQDDPTLPLFLFNELAINVAWQQVSLSFPAATLDCLRIDDVELGRIDPTPFKDDVEAMHDRLHAGTISDGVIIIEIETAGDWLPIENHCMTNNSGANLINLFEKDEGKQQEHLALWLTDGLSPIGSFHSLEVPEGNGKRELTDITLTYEGGSFLIESKALSLLGRDTMPSLPRLKKNVSNHIRKAISQLRGAIKRVRANDPVTLPNGDLIDLEREQPMHAIVLIPDYSLIEDHKKFGRAEFEAFLKKTGSFLHILDNAELLRVVQAAQMIAARSPDGDKMAALDHYLTSRAEKTWETGELCFSMLLRFEDQT